jgi:alpha-galactosidase
MKMISWRHLAATALVGSLSIVVLFIASGGSFRVSAQAGAMENRRVRVELVGTDQVLWKYTSRESGQTFDFSPPRFEVGGKEITGALTGIRPIEGPKTLPNGVIEYRHTGTFAANPELSLETTFRIPASSPVVRFQYRLGTRGKHSMTRQKGQDNLEYFTVSLALHPEVNEVRLSEFHELPHTYRPNDMPVAAREFESRQALIGPILTASNGKDSLILAYEHGSQIPDAFVKYHLSPDRRVSLRAVKGSYYSGQPLDTDHSYATIWMEAGAIKGPKLDVERAFRTFVLRDLNVYPESRKPYIFYNTWNFQERHQAWNKGKYLDTMNLERMLEEIDVAHKMGIEVFVVDAGWFGRTGDWTVSTTRFPDGLKSMKAKLDGYGMRLGLWFTSKAAVSSRMLARHRDCVMTTNGKPHGPGQVWETEESYVMCMVSPFGDAFADELVRLAKELGVRYFKWDAFDQYGCDDPGHWHGGQANSAEERAQSYSFQLPEQMARVAERICAAQPDSIVDFDITEGERAVGLRFLAAGKYFIINNGPYYYSFDDPQLAPGGGMGPNVLVFPGLARAVNARLALDYDRWIPSVLFLTHYLPDDPEYSQWINLGSLILGQNGIWGDLPGVSAEGVKRFGETLSKYRQVRDDITAAHPVRTGEIGGTPEIHEKINSETGKGAVVFFYNYRNAWRQKAPYFPGSFRYVTRNRAAKEQWWDNGVKVAGFDSEGRAILQVDFDGPGARIVLFGAK